MAGSQYFTEFSFRNQGLKETLKEFRQAAKQIDAETKKLGKITYTGDFGKMTSSAQRMNQVLNTTIGKLQEIKTLSKSVTIVIAPPKMDTTKFSSMGQTAANNFNKQFMAGMGKGTTQSTFSSFTNSARSAGAQAGTAAGSGISSGITRAVASAKAALTSLGSTTTYTSIGSSMGNSISSGISKAVAAAKTSLAQLPSQFPKIASAATSAATEMASAFKKGAAQSLSAIKSFATSAGSALKGVGASAADAARSAPGAITKMGGVAAAPALLGARATSWAAPMAAGMASTFAHPGDVAMLAGGYGLYKFAAVEKSGSMAAAKQGFLQGHYYDPNTGMDLGTTPVPGAISSQEAVNRVKESTIKYSAGAAGQFGTGVNDIAEAVAEYSAMGGNMFQLQSNPRIMNAMLNYSAASGMGPAEAIQSIYSGALNWYGKNATQENFETLANEYTSLANLTRLSPENIEFAMKMAAPVAKTYGMSKEETFAAIGSLGQYGRVGTQGGSDLRRILARTTAGWRDFEAEDIEPEDVQIQNLMAKYGVSDPNLLTKDQKEEIVKAKNSAAADALKGFGLTYSDIMVGGIDKTTNKTITLADVVRKLSKAGMLDQGSEQAMSALKQVFGQQGITPLLDLAQALAGPTEADLNVQSQALFKKDYNELSEEEKKRIDTSSLYEGLQTRIDTSGKSGEKGTAYQTKEQQLDNLTGSFNKLKGYFEGLSTELGQYLNDSGVRDFVDFLTEEGIPAIRKFGTAISEGRIVDAGKQIGKGYEFAKSKVKEWIGDIKGVASNQSLWSQLGVVAREGISGAQDELLSFSEQFKAFTSGDGTGMIGGAFNWLKDIASTIDLSKLQEIGKNILEGLKSAFNGIVGWLKEQDWSSITSKLTTVFLNAVTTLGQTIMGLDWNGILNVVTRALQGAGEAFKKWLGEQDFEDVGEKVGNALKVAGTALWKFIVHDIKWETIFSAIGNLFGGILNELAKIDWAQWLIDATAGAIKVGNEILKGLQQSGIAPYFYGLQWDIGEAFRGAFNTVMGLASTLAWDLSQTLDPRNWWKGDNLELKATVRAKVEPDGAAAAQGSDSLTKSDFTLVPPGQSSAVAFSGDVEEMEDDVYYFNTKTKENKPGSYWKNQSGKTSSGWGTSDQWVWNSPSGQVVRSASDLMKGGVTFDSNKWKPYNSISPASFGSGGAAVIYVKDLSQLKSLGISGANLGSLGILSSDMTGGSNNLPASELSQASQFNQLTKENLPEFMKYATAWGWKLSTSGNFLDKNSLNTFDVNGTQVDYQTVKGVGSWRMPGDTGWTNFTDVFSKTGNTFAEAADKQESSVNDLSKTLADLGDISGKEAEAAQALIAKGYEVYNFDKAGPGGLRYKYPEVVDPRTNARFTMTQRGLWQQDFTTNPGVLSEGGNAKTLGEVNDKLGEIAEDTDITSKVSQENADYASMTREEYAKETNVPLEEVIKWSADYFAEAVKKLALPGQSRQDFINQQVAKNKPEDKKEKETVTDKISSNIDLALKPFKDYSDAFYQYIDTEKIYKEEVKGYLGSTNAMIKSLETMKGDYTSKSDIRKIDDIIYVLTLYSDMLTKIAPQLKSIAESGGVAGASTGQPATSPTSPAVQTGGAGEKPAYTNLAVSDVATSDDWCLLPTDFFLKMQANQDTMYYRDFIGSAEDSLKFMEEEGPRRLLPMLKSLANLTNGTGLSAGYNLPDWATPGMYQQTLAKIKPSLDQTSWNNLIGTLEDKGVDLRVVLSTDDYEKYKSEELTKEEKKPITPYVSRVPDFSFLATPIYKPIITYLSGTAYKGSEVDIKPTSNLFDASGYRNVASFDSHGYTGDSEGLAWLDKEEVVTGDAKLEELFKKYGSGSGKNINITVEVAMDNRGAIVGYRNIDDLVATIKQKLSAELDL